jgi:hypothetical protein
MSPMVTGTAAAPGSAASRAAMCGGSSMPCTAILRTLSGSATRPVPIANSNRSQLSAVTAISGGTLHRVCGDLARAERCHQQGLELARAISSPWTEAHALAGLGRCALAAGRATQAEILLRQALEIFQPTGAPRPPTFQQNSTLSPTRSRPRPDHDVRRRPDPADPPRRPRTSYQWRQHEP